MNGGHSRRDTQAEAASRLGRNAKLVATTPNDLGVTSYMSAIGQKRSSNA